MILRQKSERSRKALTEQYGDDIYDEEETFLAIMDEYTHRPFVVILIDNVSKEKAILDTIEWDKADDPGPFRFGCDSYWEKNGMDWEEQLKMYPPARKLDRETLSQLQGNIRLDNYAAAKQLEKATPAERSGKNAFICPALLQHHNSIYKR